MTMNDQLIQLVFLFRSLQSQSIKALRIGELNYDNHTKSSISKQKTPSQKKPAIGELDSIKFTN